MRHETKQVIKERIREKMDDIIARRIRELPADMRSIAETNPFGSRLVPQEVWRGSKFERSFSTSFGTGVYEQIAQEIAIDQGAFAENQHTETITLNTWQDEAINNLLTSQRGAETPKKPNWEQELRDIRALANPRRIDLEIRFDLYVRRTGGQEEYYSLKTVKPNLDQTEIAKRDMLRVSVAKPECRAYLALPYNPFGDGRQYRWTMPKKLFDMNDSSVVLIGGQFWNTVGNEDTLAELLDIFGEAGVENYARITSDYFELEL